MIEHYRTLLAGEPMLGQAMCLTVVTGCTPEQALARMGADQTTIARRTVAETEWPAALAAPVAGGAVVLEPNGFQATRPEVIRALTAGDGRSTTVFWDVSSEQLLHAEAGKVRWSFSPFHEVDSAEVRGVIDGLPFDDELFPAPALVVLERATGFRLDAEWLAAPHLSASLIELPEDIVAPEYADHPALAEPEIAAILADPSTVDTRRIDVIAAERAIRVTGIDEPVVAEALRLLRAEERVPAELIEELTAVAADIHQCGRAEQDSLPPGTPFWSSRAGELDRQAAAVRSVLGAAGVMPHFACFNADLAVLAIWQEFLGDSLVISVMKNVRGQARKPE